MPALVPATAAGTYLDTAAIGLPPPVVLDAVRAEVDRWAAGEARAPEYDADVDAARASFARLLGVPVERVAVGSQVSAMAGVLAASLEPGARVLCAEEDFTSVLFPFLAQRSRGVEVRLVPLARIAEAVDGATTLVAVSSVQSSDGRVADLDALAAAAEHHGALTFVDATQSTGWLPLDAGRFDAVAAGTYKWLVSPRGAALWSVSDRLLDRVRPHAAGWYAGEDRWTSLYREPLRLAASARRLDLSPAWLSWVGTAAALRLFEELTVARVHDHDLGLANALRARARAEPGDSAIVSLAVDDGAAERLRRAGIAASLRAGRLRVSFHLHNDEDDVDRVAAALGLR
jgi:selenocysteine lyase/cysteine desulfurase